MQALGQVYNTLLTQASFWAFVDIFRTFGTLRLVCLPLVLLFKKLGAKRRAPMLAH